MSNLSKHPLTLFGISVKENFYIGLHEAFTTASPDNLLKKTELHAVRDHFTPTDVEKVANIRDMIINKIGNAAVDAKEFAEKLEQGLLEPSMKNTRLWFERVIKTLWGKFDDAQDFIIRFITTMVRNQILGKIAA